MAEPKLTHVTYRAPQETRQRVRRIAEAMHERVGINITDSDVFRLAQDRGLDSLERYYGVVAPTGST